MVYVLLAAVVVVYAFPLYWTAVTSLKSLPEMTAKPPTLWPKAPLLANYREIFVATYFTRYAWNSLIVAIGTSLLTVTLAVAAAFSLARFAFVGRRLLGHGILTVYLFPGILLVTPLYVVMMRLGLYDTLWSLILVDVLYSLPFAVWTLRAFIDGVPRELEECARIDGASWMQVLVRVYAPLLKPALATTAIYAFVIAWNEYLFASVLVTGQASQTLPVGLAGWTSSYTINWGQVSAASILSLVPTVLFFTTLGPLFVKGLTQGAVKG
ncbi:MAG: carbohydrate ABC transporter permease [Bacillota bacterium]